MITLVDQLFSLGLAWETFMRNITLTINLWCFQASATVYFFWVRFVYLHHRWGGPLSKNWLSDQLILQKQILSRMLELGMTPGPRKKSLYSAPSIDLFSWHHLIVSFCCLFFSTSIILRKCSISFEKDISCGKYNSPWWLVTSHYTQWILFLLLHINISLYTIRCLSFISFSGTLWMVILAGAAPTFWILLTLSSLTLERLLLNNKLKVPLMLFMFP